MGSLLGLADITLSYPDGVTALDGVDVRVDTGEIVAVMGPSGCGKSTILQIAAGLLAPTSGTVHRSTDRVGYVFQDPTLLPWRTVRRNVELFGELTGLPAAERRTRSTAALTAVGLADFATHRPAHLSGGMRMRTALARALLVNPDLLLLDEPFASLDEPTRHTLTDDLLTLATTHAFGALFVTHSASEAVYVADRVHVLSPRPGRVTTTVEVPFPRPRTPTLRADPTFATLTTQVATAMTT